MEFDEDALICDLAETYQIYDYRSLPLKTVATLSAGLRDDSRIKLKAAKSTVPLDTILLAVIADKVEAFRYGWTEDAKNGTNQPQSIVSAILGEEQTKTTRSCITSFATPEEFEAALARIRGE